MLCFNSSAGDKIFNINEPGRYLEQFLTIQVGNVSGHDYQKYEKGYDARITYMTCDEYLQHCVDDIFNSTWERTVNQSTDAANIHKLANLMRQGVQMEGIPYLNYANHMQEGRHRALAFKEAFGADAKLPVVEIYRTQATLEEIYAYCYKKFEHQDPESSAKWYMQEIAPRLGYSSKEVCDFLGIPYEEPDWETVDEEENDLELDDDILLEDYEDVLADGAYDEMLAKVAEAGGMSVEDLDKLDAFEFAKLVDKVMK